MSQKNKKRITFTIEIKIRTRQFLLKFNVIGNNNEFWTIWHDSLILTRLFFDVGFIYNKSIKEETGTFWETLGSYIIRKNRVQKRSAKRRKSDVGTSSIKISDVKKYFTGPSPCLEYRLKQNMTWGKFEGNDKWYEFLISITYLSFIFRTLLFRWIIQDASISIFVPIKLNNRNITKNAIVF